MRLGVNLSRGAVVQTIKPAWFDHKGRMQHKTMGNLQERCIKRRIPGMGPAALHCCQCLAAAWQMDVMFLQNRTGLGAFLDAQNG
jgi:hypothetical protein